MVVAGALAGLGGATVVLGTAANALTGDGGRQHRLRRHPGRACSAGPGRGGRVRRAAVRRRCRPAATGCSRFSGISLELVSVLQALIVIFVAAPALVKAIFRLRAARAARLGTSMAKGW